MEERFGVNNVCSVGTYGNLKLKMIFTDLSRAANIPIQEVKIMTSILGEGEKDGTDWSEIFHLASKSQKLMGFIERNPDIIHDAKLCLMQPRSTSVHACATIITPNSKDIYRWFPVKKMQQKDGEDILISEWEGIELDKAGFLKEDILGILQLDKFASIIKQIKENRGETINFKKIPLDDEKVYRYFSKGWNSDVFQFGTSGLKKYTKELKPDSMDELMATNALFRPGAMKSNAHNDFVLVKFGKKEAEYDYMLEEVTKNTYGLYIYQEQTMLAAKVLGGFTLVEADMMRKIMLGRGKKQFRDQFYIYHDKFLAGAVERGCEEVEAEKIWQKLEAFAGYGFNRCISGTSRFKRLGFNKSGLATFIPTIEEMYKIKNDKQYARATNHLELYGKFNKYGYGVAFSMNENSRIVKNKIVDIRYEGQRLAYRVTLESDEYIDVTENHKFPTTTGEKQLNAIDLENDKIYVNEGYDRTVTNPFAFTTKSDNSKNNPFAYKYKLNSSKNKVGFQKYQDTQLTLLEEYLNDYKKDKCEECGEPHRRLEAHHKNGFHGDNRFENLITLCPSRHKKAHYAMGRKKQGEKGLLTRTEYIVLIEELGLKDVYDVEMADPYHNFVLDNGIVTSNSHASAYAITGYISQWFKVNYPIEFWTTAFKFAKDDLVSSFISEIHASGVIKISPPDVNESDLAMTSNYKTNTIYWGLSSIKGIGPTASEQLMKERADKGEYFSLDEFVSRHSFKGSKVNKTCIENLIFSGAFDKIENVENSLSRKRLIDQFRANKKVKIDGTKDLMTVCGESAYEDWWWDLQQKKLSGLAFFDYETICDRYLQDKDYKYIDQDRFQDENLQPIYYGTGGIINEVIVRESKKKGKYCSLIIESNCEFMRVTIFPDQYAKLTSVGIDFVGSEGDLIVLTGMIKYDDYQKCNAIKIWDRSELRILK